MPYNLTEAAFPEGFSLLRTSDGWVLGSEYFLVNSLAAPRCGQELTVSNHEPVLTLTETK